MSANLRLIINVSKYYLILCQYVLFYEYKTLLFSIIDIFLLIIVCFSAVLKLFFTQNTLAICLDHYGIKKKKGRKPSHIILMLLHKNLLSLHRRRKEE